MSQISQSSSSSWRSSESRKRRASAEYSQRSLQGNYWSKRTRNKGTLKGRYIEKSSNSSVESFFKYEDHDLPRTETRSASTITASEIPVESTYASLASKFKINQLTAKKYYSILTSTPKVPIIRAVAIKKEIESPKKCFPTYKTSPVFGLKKRVRKIKKEKITPEKTISKEASQNLHHFFENLDSVKVKTEIISPNSSQSQDFFEQNSKQLQYLQPTTSQVNSINKWEELIDTSEDEFQSSKCTNLTKCTQFKSTAKKSKGFVSNPFSKDKSKRKKNIQTEQKLQQKKSFWKKTFGNDDLLEKKKKFMETFEKKNKQKNDDTDNTDNEVIFLGTLPQIKIESNSIKKGKKTTKKLGNTIKIKNERSSVKSNTSSIECIESTVNSLSVNYEPLFTRTSIKVETVTSSQSSSFGQSSLPLSFGVETSDQEHNNTEKEDNIGDNIDGPKLNTECNLQNDYSTLNNVNNSEEEQSILNDSFISMDLFDLPTKMDSKSHTERNSVRSSTPESCLTNGANKPKAKPIIISDNTLPNNTIVLPGLTNSGKKVIKLNISASPTSESNKLETASNSQPMAENSNGIEKNCQQKEATMTANNSHSDKFEFNGATRNVVDLKNTIPSARNSSTIKTDLRKLKLNINSDQTAKSNDGTEESFDSLCQDVTQLSNSENITLYKGDQLEDNEAEHEKVILPTSKFKNQAFKLPIIFNNNTNGAPSSNFQRSPRLKLNLKSTTSVKGQVSSPNVVTRLKQQQQQKTQSLINPLRLSLSNNAVSQLSRTCRSSTLNSSSLANKDPRLNRSLSPGTSLSAAERDPRLNRSCSPNKSPAIADPRLNRSSSPIKSTVNVDPRLNRSSSPIKSTVNVDPRLNRSISPIKSTVNVDPRLNRSSSPIKLSANVDPRLNRSISPIKSTANVDPRLNRSSSPLKSTIITDPRLIKESTSSFNTVPNVSLQNSEKDTDSSETNIIDPRLRKRKEREESERAVKVAKVKSDEEKNDAVNFAIPEGGQSPSKVGRKRRLSVFQRLGLKKESTSMPETIAQEVPNELLNIIKTERSRSPKKNLNYDSDDQLSLHPGELFSSDDEPDASPPHRKFTSERMRASEEIRNKPISIKDRLTWNVSGANRRPLVTMMTTTTTTTTMMTATTTTMTSGTMTNKIRLISSTSNQRQPIQTRIQLPKQPVSTFTNAGGVNAAAANISFSMYGNNDVAFNENFYKMNAAQMLKDVDNFKTQEQDSSAYVTFDSGTGEKPCKFDHVSLLDGRNEPVQIGASDARTSFFKSYCYRMLRKGKCITALTTCHFVHKVCVLQKIIKQKKPELLSILDLAIQSNFEFFLLSIWSDVLPILQNDAFSVYDKLYQANLRSERFVHELLDFCLTSKLHTVESFVKRISPIIEKDDRDTVQVICAAIKGKLTDGFCWEAIKDLSQKAVPPRDMIELTLIQCLKRKKNQTHILEVYDLVKNKMSPLDRNKMSVSMLKQFFNLVQSKGLTDNKESMTTVPLTNTTRAVNNVQSRVQTRSQSIDSIETVDETPTTPVLQSSTTATINKRRLSLQESNTSKTSVSTVQQPNNSPLEVRVATPNKGEITNFSEYVVKEVDSGSPESSFRDRFWKLYVAVYGVNEGLSHIDYDYVWKIMDDFSKENVQDELLRRAYYHILCKNVKNSERHVSEIIKRAVRTRSSSTRKSIDVLFSVGVCALIDLANNELWVMALELLNSVKIVEPHEPNTAFVLISAEIYLANNDPLEALYLLQRTRLIRTNRDEWLTSDGTKEHEKHRNKVVFILLKALSYAEPEKAVYLFKILMEDQYISYYPIDLPTYLDKLTLLLLLHNKEELIPDLCRIVMDNDLTFQKATYQELLRQMLSIDEVLTNQILDYAMHLGYYNDIQIRQGFTTVIIDSNCFEEELYLIMKRLINKLVLSIGPVIPHLKPNQLKVILIFEDIPVDRRLYKNEVGTICKDRYKHIRNMVNTLLATRFTPSIRISRSKMNKYCKLVSRTLVDYLKHWN